MAGDPGEFDQIGLLRSIRARLAGTSGATASGVTPVSGTFAATGQSASFTPLAGRDFNVYLAATANTVQLERYRDAAWEVVLTPALIAALPPSFTWSEPQTGVAYRLNCTAYSASQAYGFSQ